LNGGSELSTRQQGAIAGPLDTTRWAVAIPSFNHADDVIACLTSLREASATPSRVIVVDDASTEDAVGAISSWAAKSGVKYQVVDADSLGEGTASPWLTIAAGKTNAGFSVSCNIGLRYVRDHTDAPFVLLLNNDAAVSKSYFMDLAAGIATRRNVGLATGTIYEWDQRTVWFAGGRFNPLRAVAEHYLDIPSDGAPRKTDFICGCTMLIARRALETVGLIPEIYSPAYCEDAEYSLKVAQAGFELAYVPGASAFHRVSSSLGGAVRPPQVIYWFNRNRGYAVRRNFRGWRRAAGIGYLAVTKPARAVWELVRGRPRSAAAFIRGTAAGLFGQIDDRY
jgi:GT2 family glycosyltransferase